MHVPTFDLKVTVNELCDMETALLAQLNRKYHVMIVLPGDKCDRYCGWTSYRTLPDLHAESVGLSIPVPVCDIRPVPGLDDCLVSDFIVLETFDTIFHQAAHCWQADVLCHMKLSDIPENELRSVTVLGLSFILMCAVPEDCCTGHYRESPLDVHAECLAIAQTHKFLSECFADELPAEKLNEVMLGYLNERCRLDEQYPLRRYDTGRYDEWIRDDDYLDNVYSRCLDDTDFGS